MRKTWIDTLGQTIINAVKAATDLLPSDPASESGALYDKVVETYVEALDIERHIHNRERWFGKSADQSGDDWAVEAGLTVFQAISGKY